MKLPQYWSNEFRFDSTIHGDVSYDLYRHYNDHWCVLTVDDNNSIEIDQNTLMFTDYLGETMGVVIKRRMRKKLPPYWDTKFNEVRSWNDQNYYYSRSSSGHVINLDKNYSQDITTRDCLLITSEWLKASLNNGLLL